MSRDLPYQDPLSLIWLSAAVGLGIRVERARDVFASWDGRGTLSIAADEDLDPDDSVAQMILHEICHALVAGPTRASSPDWGLDNTSPRDVMYEHATNRLQAALADAHGLRRFFATTTEFRAYYDALPDDPLAGEDDPAVAVARDALRRAREGTWWPVIHAALRATAEVAAAVRVSAEGSLWQTAEPLHRTGFVLGPNPGNRCAGCAWSAAEAKGELTCRQARLAGNPDPVFAEDRACRLFEARLTGEACAACGACCREGFHVVPVLPEDAVGAKYPGLVVHDEAGAHIPRPGGRCLALVGTGTLPSPYRCGIYGERPAACAHFEIGGDACLEARRRVGLSR